MLYSLDDLDGFKRTSNGLYDIFGTTVIYDIEQNFYVYVVLPEHEMRLDLICDYLYTHTDFIEELMVVNNIYNPWNIKEGDEILYFSPENLMILHGGKDDDSAFDKLTKFQEKKPDGTPKLSPTMKPKGLSQVTNDKKAGRIRITNKLE